MLGPLSRVFHLISSTYGWTDEMILDHTLKRIRQIIAVISEDKIARSREERLMLSWQTRSLAMVMAAAGGNPSEEIMKFAANLTIDTEEYQLFNNLEEIESSSKSPVHATTQDQETEKNFNKAADKNNFEMMGLFGMKLAEGKPG